MGPMDHSSDAAHLPRAREGVGVMEWPLEQWRQVRCPRAFPGKCAFWPEDSAFAALLAAAPGLWW